MKLKGDQKLSRRINNRLVFKAIKKNKKISRADISRITGLSKASVTKIVNGLMKSNIIEECGKEDNDRVGRKSILLQLNKKDVFLISVTINDLGMVSIALNSLTGEIKNKKTFKCDCDEEILKLIEGQVNSINKTLKGEILGLGIGICGMVDSDKGVILSAVNPNWSDFKIVNKLNKRLDIPIYLENLTATAAIGEWWYKYEESKNIQSLIYIQIDDSVGSAAIINGELFSGSKSSNMEFGHIAIKEDGKICSCGRRGCIESLISKKVIYDKTDEIFNFDDEDQVSIDDIYLFLAKKSYNESTAHKEIINYISYVLGRGIADLINLFGPDLVVLDFELNNSKYFFEKLINNVKDEVLPPLKNVKIQKTKQSNENELLGAGVLVLRSLFL